MRCYDRTMRPTDPLDRTDIKILEHLQREGRCSNVELAEAVNLSPSPCLTRTKRMEETGVIAGDVSSDPWFARLFRGPNDGKVSVQSARLEEMQDFMVVRSGHTLIMRSSTTIDQVMAFLKHGRFNR